MSESMRDMLAREAAEAEERADAEERGEVTPAPGQRGRRRAVDPSQVYAVRIPVSQLRKLREVADSLGMQPSALIRQWVIERLDALDASGVSHLEESQLPAAGEVKLGPRRVSVVRERDERDSGQLKSSRQVRIRA
jgi:aryl-alcohol dehydrogenase-like predicted oxidoreductase